MAHENKNLKWKGKAIAELKTTKAEQVWPLFEDFCTIHKWIPTMDTSHYVQGTYGEPGLVRYCATNEHMPKEADQTQTTIVKWLHEKLLSIDPVQRCLSYESIENNMGITSYVAEWKVIQLDTGCKIEWSFTVDPMDGVRFEDFYGVIESSCKNMAERIEKELQAPTI